uniref:Uncharacterized protein n=1 Tax=uncultured marine virus TaxID=186617 RepID=A0A0F7L8D8_9VIRU|nr:hypothetical protein [uncultured marine virus]
MKDLLDRRLLRNMISSSSVSLISGGTVVLDSQHPSYLPGGCGPGSSSEEPRPQSGLLPHKP